MTTKKEESVGQAMGYTWRTNGCTSMPTPRCKNMQRKFSNALGHDVTTSGSFT
jgi:hypothetical protein